MQVKQRQYVAVMAAAMLLHYILFTVMNMNCACASCSMRHETLALAMRSICIFFSIKTDSFECHEVSNFFRDKRAKMKGFLIDSYRKSLLSQDALRQRIRHRC